MWNTSLPPAEWIPLCEHLDGVIREVLDQDVVAIDTETTGLSRWADVPLYWSLAWGDHRRICMPISTLPLFREAFADRGKRWVFANAKFDMHMLANVGVQFAGDCVDTAVMHALLYEEESHELKEMSKKVLGWTWSDFFTTFKPRMVPDGSRVAKLLKSGRLSQPTRRETNAEMLHRCERDDLGTLIDYASNDAYGTLRLYEALKKELERTGIFTLYPEWLGNMADLFFLTEVPFTKVLWKCERNGVYAHRPYLQELRKPMMDEVEQLHREMVRLSGSVSFNPDSTPQLQEYFFGREKLEPVRMTSGGKSGVKKPSTDRGFLEHYEHESQMAGLVLRYRKLTKLISTYIDGADEHFDHNGRIHTKFNQDVARTGRLSSSDPNLQNIPQPDKDKFQLRGAFQAQFGSKNDLIVMDYSQLEMRLLACATVTKENPAGAKEMIDIFLNGKDIHMGNAEMVFGSAYEKKYGWRLTYDLLKEAKKIDGLVKEGKLPAEARTRMHEMALFARNAIKSVGFGLNYGMKEGKLARQLGISKEEALDIIDAYLGAYPAVSGFYADAINETRKTGYSFTLLGRRRCHPAILSSNKLDRWSDERKAVNNQIQGTAADAVRLAMIRLDQANLVERFGCNMLLQVHDELMFECPKETTKEASEEIRKIMEHPFPTDLAVPLDVSLGIGPSWNRAH